MKGTPATYGGKIISKDHFRVYIYGANGEKKLVNSWDEYEKFMESGVWFATKEDAMANVLVHKEAPKTETIKLAGIKPKVRKSSHIVGIKDED